MHDLHIVLQLLAKLLSNSPEIGSRLKLRLSAECQAQGIGPFSYTALGYRSFKDFLENGTDGMVDIEFPDGPGDLKVSLRDNLRELYRPISLAGTGDNGSPHSGNALKSAVWQAFCNPDINRRRFLHIASASVRHFTVQDGTPPDIAEHGADFIEITPIGGDEQLAWMRSFISRTQLGTDTATLITSILSEPYSSRMNASFTQALGNRADAWRRERVAKIEAVIRSWADRHQYPVHKLYVMGSKPGTGEAAHPPVFAEPTINTGVRQKTQQLLQMLSDDDIARLVLPSILDAILKTSQR